MCTWHTASRVSQVIFLFTRYYDGRFSDQQMALLQYQRENIHYLSEEVLGRSMQYIHFKI